jgi:hypothetical protein
MCKWEHTIIDLDSYFTITIFTQICASEGNMDASLRHSVQNGTASLSAAQLPTRWWHSSSLKRIVNSHSAVHIVPRLQKHTFATWLRLHVYTLGSRITFLYNMCSCDFTALRTTGYELGCRVAVFVMGVGTVSSPSWTSKLWSTSSHLMGAADSSPNDRGR